MALKLEDVVVVRLTAKEISQRFAVLPLSLELTSKAVEFLAKRGYDPQYGARPLKRVIQRWVQDPLAMKILEGEFMEGAKVLVDARVSGDALEFRLRD